MMDISYTLAPDSQQLDAVDLLGGPRVFTIESVSKGPADQPVQIHLAEFPRPWRPGKSMRRILVACWGPDASKYVGRSVRLYCDETVRFGSERVGGTRVSHLSHIDKPQQVPLLISRGKSAIYTVEPLTDAPVITAPVEPTPQQVSSCADVDTLTGWLEHSRPQVQAAIRRRITELQPDGGPMVTAPTITGDEPWPQSGESLLDQSTP